MDKSAGVVLGMTQTMGLFGTFLPSFSEVRRANRNDPDMLADIRLGEASAVALCLGVGAVASNLSDSNVPIISALVTAAVLVALYEYALNRSGNDD